MTYPSTTRGLHRRSAAVLVLAIAAIALAVWLWPRSQVPVDPSVAAIHDATRGALTTLFFDAFPPASYAGGRLPAPTALDMHARVAADFARYLAPSLRAHYEPMIQGGIDAIGTGDWDVDGGIASIDWRMPIIAGDQASISLRETQWVVRRQYPGTGQASSYRLDSTSDWNVHLARLAGSWRVDGLDSACVSGCP